MGRGRKGALNQSMKKMNLKNNGGIAKVYGRLHKSDEKISLHEDILELMKNVNQQELVDFLLSDDDWHVKHQASMLLDVDLISTCKMFTKA